ncbi:hypothetical protein CK203_087862 [Vitis vinifera]|uniref:SWIM-type domain-containing protein n=1 Tax=Vitis vinifera TaxID=29760 RepID=A0A438DQR4_VITVI|nr:hypothetical protein CK203_087862 [Vitis vinifera]
MTFEEFTQKVLEKFDISLHVMRMHYTLKFNPRVIQDLEDEDDLDNVVSHSDDFANVYIVESPGVEAIEANIPNTQLALGGPHPTFPSSNASCDANPNTMMLSRGFASRCADTEYTPLESNRFREAILGSGHTFKNADEFRNAIYQMSLAGRFQYKYKKNSPTHMSVKCSVEDCPWKITAHAVEGNEILRVYTYQVNHNHIAQDECSSKVRVSSKRGAVVVEDVFRTTPEYLPRQICKDFERDHGVQLTYNQAWHLKEKAKERVYGSPRASYAYLPWLCHRLREINPGTIAEYTSHEGHFKQLFIAHVFSIQGFTMGCRPVLAIDSCHLSGPYKGALLSAIAYDADNGTFPLALGVVGSENYEDWYWFLEKLKGILDDQEGKERERRCFVALDNIAYARLDIDYNEAFEKLVCFNGDLARWVAENSPEHWAMSKFLKKRWDKMTTNIAESFNAWLREECHQTIYTLLMMHMDKLVAMLDTHMRVQISGRAWFFTREVYLVVDMQQHKCTCLTWQMSGLPCPHVCAVIRTLRHDVYDYIDPCFKVSTQQLIYSDGQGNVFPSLQPPQVRRPPGRPRQRRIESQFSHKRAIHCSRCNGIVIILTMAGNGLDGSAASSLPLSAKTMSSRMREEGRGRIKRGVLGTSMFTRCSAARFKKLCNRLPEAKIQAIRDLQFGGLLNLNCTEVTSTSSDHPFGTIRACEEKLLDLPVGEEFRRAFIYYACATLLAPTSRLNGCRNLWHTIHEDGFRNDVNWAQFVLDQLVEGIRRYQQSKTSWVHGCVLFLQASQRSPTVERTMEPETNVDHDTNVDAENSDEIWHQYHDAERAIDQYQRGIQQQLRIMRGLMHKLGTRRHSGVNSDAGGHSSYAPASTPTVDDHAFPGDEYMASHAAYHVLDTPDRVVAPEYELQPSVPINVVSDGEEQPEGNVVPTNRNVRRRRVRRMAPNLLSPYISQPQTKQSAIKIDLKQGAALVFGDDLDASEELVSMHDTILTKAIWVFLPVLIKNHWTLYVYDLENRRIQLLDSRPGRKKTMLSGVQQNLAKVVLWLAAHKKEVYIWRSMNRSRRTRGPESMKCSTGRYFASAVDQPIEPFFSRWRTRYWMREGGFWHPRPEIDRSISFGRPVPGG